MDSDDGKEKGGVTAVSYTHLDVYKRQRIVCFDIKELGKQLKKIGMLVIQNQVWNRVTMNRSAHKSTRYYVDAVSYTHLDVYKRQEPLLPYSCRLSPSASGMENGLRPTLPGGSLSSPVCGSLDVYKRQH